MEATQPDRAITPRASPRSLAPSIVERSRRPRGATRSTPKAMSTPRNRGNERGEQGEAPAHRLEYGIEEQRHGAVARARDQARCQTESAANEEGEPPGQEHEQVKDTGKPHFETQRRFSGVP